MSDPTARPRRGEPTLVAERIGHDAFVPPWTRHEHLERYEFAAGLVSDQVVVDGACGTGYGSEMLANAGARRVFGFDVCAEAVQLAGRRHEHARVGFAVADVGRLPLPAASVDVFVSFETIEHLPDDRPFLREVCRVLRPAGRFVCSTPNRTVTNPGRSLHDPSFNPHHVREYSLPEYQELLGRSFTRVECFGQNLKRAALVRRLDALGRRGLTMAIVRARQILKLPLLLLDRKPWHRVRELPADYEPEFVIAVCSGPR